ncbi:MAG: lytic murein transglycosylase B [Spongiibacteraceae bacterium]
MKQKLFGKKFPLLRTVFALAVLFAPLAHADYRTHALAPAFVDEMVQKHGFVRADVEALLADAARQQSILTAIARPKEQTAPWKEYRKGFINNDRVQGGVQFWREHAVDLARVEKELGVDPAVVVAIIGVETRFGRNMGGFRVLDALTTLAFDYPPRAKFFREQLVEFLLLCREKGLVAEKQKGSYAGAMGYGQFMPGSYRNYAIDFNGDGHIDILTNPTDAIGSVANYLKRHGWISAAPIAVRAAAREPLAAGVVIGQSEPRTRLVDYRLQGVLPVPEKTQPAFSDNTAAALMLFDGEAGNEYWLGFNNFYVITRYNRSQMYALAVMQLSEAIAAQPR